MSDIKYLHNLAKAPVLHVGEWVDYAWAKEHFGSDCEAEFVSTFTPELVLSLLEQIVALQCFVDSINKS